MVYTNMTLLNFLLNGDIVGGSININNVFTVDSSGNMNATSGKVGGWNIGETSLYSGYINTSIGYMNAVLSPGGLSFDLLGQNNTMIINALNIGWDSNDLCSLIKRDSITTQELSLKQLNFIMLSNPKITCPSGYLTFDTTNNVHFKNTPYIDNYSSYLAREEWCNDRFALKSSLSSYLTKSTADGYYVKKSHTHSSYQTASDVRSIVRKMVKSSSLK